MPSPTSSRTTTASTTRRIADGPAAAVEVLTPKFDGQPDARFEIQRILVDGDLAMVHVKASRPGAPGRRGRGHLPLRGRPDRRALGRAAAGSRACRPRPSDVLKRSRPTETTMYQLAPNIELLFTEAGDYHDRVRAAAARASPPSRCGGRPASTRPRRPKDIPALKAALEETGTQLDRPALRAAHAVHDPAVGPLASSTASSTRASRSPTTLGMPAHRRRQRHRLRRLEAPGAARQAHRDLPEGDRADRGFGHHARARSRSTCASTTRARCWTAPAEAVYVARGVDSPFFGVLYDLYHSTVEGEDMAAELANAGDLVKYVQLADAPGPRRARHRRRSTGPRASASCAPPATTDRSASSTTRPAESRRVGRSSSAKLAADA